MNFFGGFLKDRIYSENIGNVSILKERIKQKCAEISEEVCKRVISNLRYRLNYCIMKNGKHFSNIMKENRMPLNIVNPSNSM